MADGWSQEIGLRLYALGKNLQLLLFPYPLLMMYVYDSVPMVEAYEMESLVPLVVYGLIVLTFIREIPKRSVLGFALGFFLISLFLFSNFIFSIPNIISERWLLMPSLGICLCMALCWHWFDQQSRTGSSIILAVVCFAYSGYTIQRNADWKSNLSLAQADIRKAPTNYNVTRMLGPQLYAAAEEKDMDPALLRESAKYLERTLRLSPGEYHLRNTLGIVYEELGQHTRAALEFAEVMRYKSDIQEKAKYSYAKNQVLAGNYSNALNILDELKTNHPKHTGVKELQATALKGIDKNAEAHSIFSEILSQKPDHTKANQHFAKYYLELAKGNGLSEDLLARSAQYHEKWLANEQNNLTGHNTLGQIYERLGKYAAAAKHFSIAAGGPSPIQGKAAFSAAKNLTASGQLDEAQEAWLDLQEEYPNLPEVTMGLADSLRLNGDLEAARSAYKQVLDLIDRLGPEGTKKYAKTKIDAQQALNIIPSVP
jgi:predicted Zn-dependent protease